jgi:hypothetical protein
MPDPKYEYWCNAHNDLYSFNRPGHDFSFRPCKKEACEKWNADKKRPCFSMRVTKNGRLIIPTPMPDFEKK